MNYSIKQNLSFNAVAHQVLPESQVLLASLEEEGRFPSKWPEAVALWGLPESQVLLAEEEGHFLLKTAIELQFFIW